MSSSPLQILSVNCRRSACGTAQLRSLSTLRGKAQPPVVHHPYAATQLRALSSSSRPNPYAWVDIEAAKLIALSYQIHKPDRPFPPSLNFDRAKLETLHNVPHYPPQDVRDRVALSIVHIMEKAMGLVFREKYDHHAVTLETVAAVPGFVASMHRHMRSLRGMKRDHGWIGELLEESQNERMHLLIWMEHTRPTLIERLFVLVAQGAYVTAYSILYVVSPQTAHRSVGYLEECAHRAYNEYLEAIDSGAIKNVPAGSIAKRFYRLPNDATLRDVVLHVRGDEAYHALFNHHLGDCIKEGRTNEEPTPPEALHGGLFGPRRSPSFVKEEKNQRTQDSTD